ncbi:MAG TPA: peptide deformylase [Candidatus Limnocylindria bacterium]|nr:peptide deformylase [Candidatus Limnocylindria bacterium]
MKTLDIRVLGDPILRQDTTPVAEVTDELRQLVEDMYTTMYAAEGIGLAAPQVGRTERLAVVDVEGAKYALINPEILTREGSARAEEGCLSIPDVFGEVERPQRITVRALDIEGRQFELAADELLARAIQHEVDHLHGKLFLDYLGVFKRRSALAQWEKLKKDYPGMIRKVIPGEAQSRRSAEHSPTAAGEV